MKKNYNYLARKMGRKPELHTARKNMLCAETGMLIKKGETYIVLSGSKKTYSLYSAIAEKFAPNHWIPVQRYSCDCDCAKRPRPGQLMKPHSRYYRKVENAPRIAGFPVKTPHKKRKP